MDPNAQKYPPQQGAYPPQQQPPHQPQPIMGGAPPPQQNYQQQQGVPPTYQGGQPVYATQHQSYQQQPLLQPQRLMFREMPQQHTCQFCHANMVTTVSYDTGGLTWLIAAGMCFFGLGLCAWIPCIIDGTKDCTHRCSNCHAVVGVMKRL